MKPAILIVDDEKNSRDGLEKLLKSQSANIYTAQNGVEALERLHISPVDIIISDIRMPRMDGLELLKKVREQYPLIDMILLTGYATLEDGVKALQDGAHSYITKPVRVLELEILIKRILERKSLERENQYLRDRLRERFGLDNLVGKSPPMQKIFNQIKQIAPARTNVLITGESGTGKELAAFAIHHNSPRAEKPFIPVNCAALTESLLESELFGHEKGSFTGAVKQKKGYFEVADQGTIFLDEIGEISLSTQVKLLRVLEKQSFERVGGTQPIQIDIRLIAATNMNLEEAVAKGKFRDDLYYRLKVLHMTLPPLRERREDIPLLIDAFLTDLCREHGKHKLKVSPDVVAKLQSADWPGNVRQLRNTIESMIVLAGADTLRIGDLPAELRGGDEAETMTINRNIPLAEAERQIILETLTANNNNRTKTSEILGIGRRTLIRKLKEYGIIGEENEK